MSIERALNVHIATTSDTKGVREVREQVEGTKNAFTQLTEKVDEAYTSSEKLEGAHHKLREGMRIIGENTAPELGNALFAAAEGPVGIALAAGIAFSYFNDKIKEFSKGLDEAAEAMANGSFKDALDARRDALIEAGVAAASWADKLAHLISNEDQYAAQVKNVTEALHAQFAAQAQVDDAQKGAAIAEIEKRRALHQISDAQAIVEQAKVEEFYHKKKIEQNNKESDSVLLIKKANLAKNESIHPDTDPKKADDAATLVLGDKARLETAIEAKKGLDKKAADAEAQYQSHVVASGYFDVAYVDAKRQAVIDKRQATIAAQTQGQKDIDDLRGLLPADERKADESKAELERNRAEVERLTKENFDLKNEISIGEQAKADRELAAGPIGEANAQESSSKTITALAGTTEGQQVVRAHQVEEAMRQHQKIAADDAAFFASFENLLKRQGQLNAAAMVTIQHSVDSVDNLLKEIEAVRQAQKAALIYHQ